MDKKVEKVEKVEKVIDNTFKFVVETPNKTYTGVFNEPDGFIYSNAYDAFKTEDKFKAVEILIKNTFVSGDKEIVKDESVMVLFSMDFINKFFSFRATDIPNKPFERLKEEYETLKKDNKNIHILQIQGEDPLITVDAKQLFFRAPKGKEIKTLFNLASGSSGSIRIVDYCFENLLLGGDDITNEDLIVYMSIIPFSTTIMLAKQFEIKKK